MKVKARSIVIGNLIGTLLWILGVAALNVIVYLIFGEANISVYLTVFSIVGLFFRLLSSCHVIFCALTNRDIEITDDKDSVEKSDQQDNNRPEDTVKTESDEKLDDNNGSLGLGILLLIIMGVGLTLIGIMNLNKEVRIFSERSKIKSQGRGAIGTIIASDRRYGYTGSKKRQYTYYVYTVRYDSFEKTSQRPEQISVGDTVPVLYLPKEPDRALIGKPGQTVSDFRGSFWNIFSLGFGFVIYSAMIIIGSGMILLIIVRGIQAVLKK